MNDWSSSEDSLGLSWDNENVVDPAGLRIGHFVSGLDRPWLSTPFSLQGVLLEEQFQIDWMRQHCQWVVVDWLQSRNRKMPGYFFLERQPPTTEEIGFSGYLEDDNASINLLRRSELDEQTVSESFEMHELLTEQAEQLVDRMTRTGQIEPASAREHVSGLADRLEQNIAAMVWLTRIKHTDQYTAQHCVNVAILSMGLAKALDWEREQIEQTGMAGMLHDLGKVKLDLNILNKPGRLTSDEYEHVKRHSRFGFEMLRGDNAVHPAIMQAVLEHHERPDGSGYPAGRTRETMLPMSALIGVVDAYDAITTRRPYSEPRSHHEALGILWKARGTQFDRTMVEALIRFLGWITPGTLVRLSTGEHAIVLRVSNKYRLWPLVRLIEKRADGHAIGERLDLAEHNAGRRENLIRIAHVLPDDSLDIQLDKALRQEVETPVAQENG